MMKKMMPGVALAALMANPRPLAVIGDVRGDAMDPGKLESLLKDVKSELTRVGDDVKKTAEQALQQSKDTGKLTDEVKQTADKLLKDQAALTEAQNKIDDRLKELSERNLDLEQRLSSRGGRSEKDAPKSLGSLVAGNDAVKAFAAAGASGQIKIEVQNAITSATTSAGALITPQRETEIVGIPRRQMTIRQLLDSGPTASNLVQYGRMTARTNNAKVVRDDGSLKPESNYTWALAEAPVRTIAHWIPVHRNTLDDAPQLQSEIDGELRYGLDLAEELEVLKGSGGEDHLLGLVPQATEFAPAFEVANATLIDTLRLALLQASLSEYDADGIVLNPIDWARIELTKDGEQRYIFANVIQMAGPQMWGRPVVATQAMDEQEFLVGAFRVAAKIYDRMATEVLISSEDRDNFVRNMLTVRAEKRLALAVRRRHALITGEFAAPVAGG